MANLKEIRSRIKSVITTQQMTKAMKMVAAAKLRRAQDNILRLRPYALKLQEIMGDIRGNMSAEDFDSPFAEDRKPEKVLLVVVTSNRGLCGAFNANMIKMAMSVAQEKYAEQHAAGNLEVLCIGKKGYEGLTRRGLKAVGENHDVFSNLNFETVSEVSEQVMEGFIEGRWDRVDLIYNEFKNVVVQVRRHEQFLPLSADAATEAPEGASHAQADYIFEPEKEEILKDLIPKSLKLQMYKAVLESNAGEQGARMSAMDNATENAQELLKTLRLTYNRARQAAITTEILEIVAGAEALASAG